MQLTRWRDRNAYHGISCTLLIVIKTKATVQLIRTNYCLEAKSGEQIGESGTIKNNRQFEPI